MLTNKIVAANVLRLYAWELLRVNGVLSEVMVKGTPLIPLIPVEDEPELRDSGKAYIIYGYSENEEGGLCEIQRGNMAFRIVAEDTNQLNHITSVLSRAFQGEDEAATSVNTWSSQYANKALVGIRFTWVKTIIVESADPASTEGGQVEGNVMVGYRYTSEQKVKTYQSSRVDGTNGAWI